MKKWASLMITVFFGAGAWACPSQNENLFVSEYMGQENLSVGYIDTDTSEVFIRSLYFDLTEVRLNGKVICSQSTQRCGSRAQALQSGPLADKDRVYLVFKSNSPAYEQKTVTFDRVGPAADQGSQCRPIFGN